MSSTRQYAQHIRVSSTEELSYTSSGSGEINDTIQTIVTGRKCWKTMKGKGEVVWPPYLEAALVEGLEKYQPVESRTTRAFGRFPMRNKFISDYIYNATGKRRTPKQVGSRLQQLRDTTEGKKILQLLSSRHMSMMQPSKSEPVADTLPAPHSSSSSSTSSGPPCTHYTIEVAPDIGSYSPSFGLSPLFSSPVSSSSSSSSSSAVPSPGPRPLRTIDNTVTFVSRTPLHAYSSFRVFQHGSERPVHVERTELELRSSSCLPTPNWPSRMETSFLYSTPLAPRFWRHLCASGNPASYTIVQDVIRATSQSTPGSVQAPEEVLLSVVYQFSVPTAPSPPLSPTHSTHGVDTDSPSFTSESSPELGSDFGDFLMYSSLGGGAAPSGPSSASNMAGAGAGRGATHNSPGGASYSSLDAHSANPGLLHPHEDGYNNSLPPSPLDLTFAASVHDGSHLALSQGPLCGNLVGFGHGGPAVYDGAPSQLSQYSFDPAYAA